MNNTWDKSFIWTFCILALLMMPLASASMKVEGLTAKNINYTITQSDITFYNDDYLNITIPHIDFFLPEELKDDLGYVTPCNPTLMVCRGSELDPIYSQSGLFHILNDPTNEVDDRFYIETDYLFTYLLYDDDWDIPTGYHNTRVNQEVRVNYNLNNRGTEKLFDTRYNITDGKYIIINVSSHYFHLIINYYYYYNNELVGNFQDVYSGEEPERLIVAGNSEMLNKSHVKQTLEYDNLYSSESKSKAVLLSYEKDTNFESIDTHGLEYSPCDSNYNNDVLPQLEEQGFKSGYIDNVNNYNFICYNVTFPSDSYSNIDVYFSQPEPVSEKDGAFGVFDNTYNYYSYIIGSIATFEVSASAEWDEGTFDGTENDGGVLKSSVFSFVPYISNAGVIVSDYSNYVYIAGQDNTDTYASVLKKYYLNGTLIWENNDNNLRITDIAIDSEGNVYSASDDHTVRKINSSGDQVWSFTGHSDDVNSVVVDSEGNVYSASDDDTVRKINSSGDQVWSFTGHTSKVYDIAIDSEGNVYSASDDNTVRKINSSGDQVWSFTGHSNDVSSVRIGDNGVLYSSGFWDKKIYAINMSSGDSIWSYTASEYISTNQLLGITKNNVYVGQYNKNYVLKLDSSGNYISQLILATSTLTGIDVSFEGDIYTVGDSGNSKIFYNGKYTSKSFFSLEKKVWNETIINVSNLINNSFITVQTSNDNFSSVNEEVNITLDFNGTKTYATGFEDDFNYVRLIIYPEIEGSINSFIIKGKTQTYAPTIPTNIDFTSSTIYVGDTFNTTASGSTDADNDSITYYYRFYDVNDSTELQAYSTNNTYVITSNEAHHDIRVYTKAYDGELYSEEYNDTITVSNTAPTVPTSISGLTGTFQVGDTITATGSGSTDADNDSITYYYRFYDVNSSTELQAYSTTNTYTITSSEAHHTIRVYTKAYDGINYSTEYNDELSVSNTAPTVPTAINGLTETFQVGDTITANASGSTDADSDSLTYYYRFYDVNSSTELQAYSTDNTYVITSDEAHHDIRVYAKAYDGSSYSTEYNDELSVSNTAPTVPTAISGLTGTFQVGDTITATASGSTDADTDSITYYYRFYDVNSSTELQAYSTDNTYVITSSEAHHDIRVYSKAYDGSSYSTEYNDELSVSNTAPTAPTNIDITPATIYVGDTITATASGSTDADTDGITYYYRFYDQTAGSELQAYSTDDDYVVTSDEADHTIRIYAKAYAYGVYSSEYYQEVVLSNTAPTTPTSITFVPVTLYVGNTLTATASGSTDEDEDSITYYYRFYDQTAASELQAYSTDNTYVITSDEAHHTIKVYSKAYDGSSYSSEYYDSISVSDTSPTTPTSISGLTGNKYIFNTITATASGSTDADTDSITYYYKFYNVNDATTVQAYSTDNTYQLQASDNLNTIRVYSKAYANGVYSSEYYDSFTVQNPNPSNPTTCSITSGTYKDDTFTATASGSTDPQSTYSITYYYRFENSAGTQVLQGWSTSNSYSGCLGDPNCNKNNDIKVKCKAQMDINPSGEYIVESSAVTSSTTNILNTNPTITVNNPYSPDLNNDNSFTVTWSASDIDSDTLYITCAGDTDSSGYTTSYSIISNSNNDGTHTFDISSWSQDNYYIWCRAYDGSANDYDYSTSYFQVNHEPVEFSASDNGAVIVNDNNDVTFIGSWSDPSDTVGFLVSESTATSTCKYSTQSTCLGYQLAQTDGTGTYTYDLTGLSGTINWYSWACDDQDRCSTQDSGSFEVNRQPTVTAPTTTPTTIYIETSVTCDVSGTYSDPDGDLETVANREFRWYKNGGLIGSETGAVVDVETSAGSFSKGDTIQCDYRTSDEHGYYSSWSSKSTSRTIQNTAPITPTNLEFSPVTIYVGDTLTANASGSTDADTDIITYYYRFYDQTAGSELQAYSTDDTYVITSDEAHHNIRVYSKAYDGTSYSDEYYDELIVSNTDPEVVILDSLPSEILANSTYTISLNITDIDLDSEFNVFIYINDDLQDSQYDLNNTPDIEVYFPQEYSGSTINITFKVVDSYSGEDNASISTDIVFGMIEFNYLDEVTGLDFDFANTNSTYLVLMYVDGESDIYNNISESITIEKEAERVLFYLEFNDTSDIEVRGRYLNNMAGNNTGVNAVDIYFLDITEERYLIQTIQLDSAISNNYAEIYSTTEGIISTQKLDISKSASFVLRAGKEYYVRIFEVDGGITELGTIQPYFSNTITLLLSSFTPDSVNIVDNTVWDYIWLNDTLKVSYYDSDDLTTSICLELVNIDTELTVYDSCIYNQNNVSFSYIDASNQTLDLTLTITKNGETWSNTRTINKNDEVTTPAEIPATFLKFLSIFTLVSLSGLATVLNASFMALVVIAFASIFTVLGWINLPSAFLFILGAAAILLIMRQK